MTVTRHPARRPLAEQDVLVLQHIRCEPPGVYEDVLRAEGARVHRVEIDEGDPLPDPSEFTHVVVMGGPTGAYDDDRYPWLGEEKRFVRAVLARGIPLFGACLGAQLLAAAVGGEGDDVAGESRRSGQQDDDTKNSPAVDCTRAAAAATTGPVGMMGTTEPTKTEPAING